METKTFTTNGEHVLRGITGAADGQTHVSVISNLDGAALVFGYQRPDGSFKAFPDGDQTDGLILDHGKGVVPMVKITGISSNSVVMDVWA